MGGAFVVAAAGVTACSTHAEPLTGDTCSRPHASNTIAKHREGRAETARSVAPGRSNDGNYSARTVIDGAYRIVPGKGAART
jgi:hypothetical protein